MPVPIISIQEWLCSSEAIVTPSLLSYLQSRSNPLPCTHLPTYTGPLTLRQQAKIIKELCDGDFKGTRKWPYDMADYPYFPKISRIGKQYQAEISQLIPREKTNSN